MSCNWALEHLELDKAIGTCRTAFLLNSALGFFQLAHLRSVESFSHASLTSTSSVAEQIVAPVLDLFGSDPDSLDAPRLLQPVLTGMMNSLLYMKSFLD